jgi:cytochrome c oxidase assembly factor CtaG
MERYKDRSHIALQDKRAFGIELKTIRLVLYIAILLLLLVAGTSSDLLEYSSTSLSFHMTIEHSIFLGLGALLVVIGGYFLQALRKQLPHIQRALRLLNFSGMSSQQQQRRGNAIIVVSCLAASVLLMGLWHWPSLFAAAVFHEDLHLIQHASFTMTGSLSLIAVRRMPTSIVILSFVLMNATMGLFSAFLLVSTYEIFIPYSLESHIEAGNVMMALSIIMAVIAFPAYIISRSLRYELKNQQNIGRASH